MGDHRLYFNNRADNLGVQDEQVERGARRPRAPRVAIDHVSEEMRAVAQLSERDQPQRNKLVPAAAARSSIPSSQPAQ